MGFNKPAVSKFFGIEHQFDGSRVYNCDKNGLQTVQRSCLKVLSRKAKQQVEALTSAGRVKTIKVMYAMSAVGNFVSPFFIFPRKIIKPDFMDCGPRMDGRQTNWLISQTFHRAYMQYKHTRPSKSKPYSSRTKNLHALEYATQNAFQ